MAVQRRTIWLDDPTWEHLATKAGQLGLNPSRYIDRLVWEAEHPNRLNKVATPPIDFTEELPTIHEKPTDDNAPRVMSQSERDAILKKVNTKTK